MTVDVVYQGLPLVKAANARSEGSGLFIELEAPMPVGTRLEIVSDGQTRSARVDLVVEGAGAGMTVSFGEKADKKSRTAEPNAPMAEMKSAPPVQVAPTDKEEEEEDDKPDDKKPSGSGGGRRSKRRKTVIGH
jgi:hypothetical protein